MLSVTATLKGDFNISARLHSYRHESERFAHQYYYVCVKCYEKADKEIFVVDDDVGVGVGGENEAERGSV